MAEDFKFIDPGALVDGDLTLALLRTVPADPAKGYVPSYEFEMRFAQDGQAMGNLRLRIGDVDTLFYAGHVAYVVRAAFRGRRYAARGLRLVMPLASAHGLSKLWIGCDPNNVASRRTCELLGAHLFETVDVPESHEICRREGVHMICRYWIDLE